MSDPYVPTTEEVREAWSLVVDTTFRGEEKSILLGLGFDRWLESLLATAGADKDERIATLESRLRADVELMNIAGIDGPGVEAALAAHDAGVRADALSELVALFEHKALLAEYPWDSMWADAAELTLLHRAVAPTPTTEETEQ